VRLSLALGGFMYQICPNCHGGGIVSQPPRFPGTLYEELEDSDASYYPCGLCHGRMVIEVPSSQPINSPDQQKLAGD